MKKLYLWVIITLFLIVISRYFYIAYYKHSYYYEQYLNATNKIIYGLNAPRGRILDSKGEVLVDNVGVNTIVYRNLNNYDLNDLASYLNTIIDVEPASMDELCKYYLKFEDTSTLLTNEEKELYNYRRLSIDDIEKIKLERIKDVINYDLNKQKEINIYYKLNKGYHYDTKIIKEDVSEEVCAKINGANKDGLSCEYTTKRVYMYDYMNDIYGKVGSITKENKEYFLDKGYDLNDMVGLSYLEKQYDDYLRGEKAKYLKNEDNSLTLLSPAKCGSDLILSIDIELQERINNIIKDYLGKAKDYRHTDYFNTVYVIVSKPSTGEIIASSGISKIKDSFYDVTTNILSNSFTVGSVVKGASHTVGYQNGLIDIGKKINDSCVKLYQVPLKCSFKRLGLIDDITALKTSSNYYQFMTAIKLTGNKYKSNMKLEVLPEHFKLYRDTFASFGLGVETGIDIENEFTGIKGSTVAPDLLLNFSIGQYDTYTPLQIVNYINTIAMSGKRYSLHYLKEIRNNEKIEYTYEPNLLNVVNSNFSRIQEGFKEVVLNGTGKGYTDKKYKPAGKTGTAEVVYSKDVTTINQTYAMYGPSDNPEYSIVVLTPNISYNNDKDTYLAPINLYISKEISKIVFEN
ncbi:MAG TPA: hypothetical protein DCE23_07245 [Firmicutes bacterium]|nr:hypothetical protein [Bacillota bacterium]